MSADAQNFLRSSGRRLTGRAGTTSLSFIQTEEGKAVPLTSGGYDYYYYLGDNLGNTRITFDTQAGVATMLQQVVITTYGIKLTQQLKNFASNNNILLTQYWATYQETNTGIRLGLIPAKL